MLTFLLVETIMAQSESIPPSYNVISVGVHHSNLIGETDPLSIPLAVGVQRRSLVNYESSVGYSLNFTSQNQWKSYPKWSMLIELGLYTVSGKLRYRQVEGSFGGMGAIIETNRLSDFTSTYAYSGYLFNYNFWGNRNLNFKFGPSIGLRLNKSVESFVEEFVVDYAQNPTFTEFRNEWKIDTDDELIGFQMAFEVGLSKDIYLGNNKLILGIDYSFPLINLHNAGRLKSHIYGMSVGYGFVKNAK